MTIIRSPRNQRDFTIISNSVCLDRRLSMRALGLLVRLLCRPDGWSTNSETLAREFDCGREQMRGVLRELSEAGYMRLEKSQDQAGRWASAWTVYDEPVHQNDQPKAGEPAPGKPYVGRPGAVSRTDVARTDTNPQTPKGAASRGVTLRCWLEEIKEAGEQAIPETDPVFAYASKAGIPDEMLSLAWAVFKADHIQGPGAKKLQKDWRQTFRNYVEKNYLKLWYVNSEGAHVLTTAGIQAQRVHEVAA